MPAARRRVPRTARAAAAAALTAAAGVRLEAQPPVPRPPRVREARAPEGTALDAAAIRDTALASLVRAEARFMGDVAARGLEGWVGNFAEDAATFPPGGPLAVGRAPIRHGMARLFADTSVHVAWHPVYATVAASGDLGYTYGYYRWTSRDSAGAPAAPDDGKFLTIWRRDARGVWRVTVDLGNSGPVPAEFFGRPRRP